MLHDKIEHYEKTKTTLRNTPAQYKTIVQPLPKTNSSVGIDLGITDFIVLSDKTAVVNPKFLAKHEKKTDV